MEAATDTGIPTLAATPSMRVRSARELGALSDPQDAENDSAKAVQEALGVLKASDSSTKDKFTALRVLLFLTFEDPSSSKLAWWLSIVLFLAIVLNCVSFIAGSIKSTQVVPKTCEKPACVPGPGAPCAEVICPPVENPILFQIELWTIVVFSVDYLIRMATVRVVPANLVFPRSVGFTMDGKIKDRSAREDMSPGRKTVKYLFSWLNIVDVVSILPFFVAMGVAATHGDAAISRDLAVMRVLRLLRIMRIFKLGKYSEGGLIIGRTMRASLPALVLFIFLTAVLTVVFGSLMYFFEGGLFQVTPEFPAGGFLRPNARHTTKELSPFTSILMGMYWVVVNTTTLGNAALFPTTTLGRLCSCFVAYTGIIALALPISIVGKNFTEQYNLVYSRVGGPYDQAPSVTAQENHDRMLLQQQEAAAAAGLGTKATTVVAKRVDSPGPSAEERQDALGKLVLELQDRLVRMEREVESLRSQLRSASAPAQLQ